MLTNTTRLTVLASVSCLLLAGCVAATVKPPYVPEPTSKSQTPCPTKDGKTSDDCKKPESK